MSRARWVVLAGLASCAVRAPRPIDIDALVTARGPLEARRELQIRALDDPRDVAARLALAALDERLGRPSAAIEALEAVAALGGPVGVRWRADDLARLARLIAARGRARLARGAGSALADLERAREEGAQVADDELRAARAAIALVALRHSDFDTRAVGRGALAELATGGVRGTTRDDVDAWRGARPGASAAERGRFGAWLWTHGARRAAWDELSAWHAESHAPREAELQDAYLVAARWWTPLDLAGPGPDELTGPARCAFGSCAPHEVAGDAALERAYLTAPAGPPVRDPADVAALAAITLRGDASWGPALAGRIELAAFVEPAQLAALPRGVQPIVARLVGRTAALPDDGATADERLVLAAERVLAGGGADAVPASLGLAPEVAALRRLAAARPPFTGGARAEAVARHAGLVVPGAVAPDALRAIVEAYAREPAIADRLGREAVAGASDAAAVHATLGAVFDALGDPARARAAWQAAVDASPEPAFLRGLAEAQARQGDADAALITATAAAAASGDPAVVWTAVARSLAGVGKYVHALDAARSAIDLAGPETLAAALDVAIAASRALGRDSQADRLAAQRARTAPVRSVGTDADPTDARAALDGYRQRSGAATLAALWVAARWNPRDVELRAALLGAIASDDPRRAAIIGELVELSGDRDPDVRRAAAAATR